MALAVEPQTIAMYGPDARSAAAMPYKLRHWIMFARPPQNSEQAGAEADSNRHSRMLKSPHPHEGAASTSVHRWRRKLRNLWSAPHPNHALQSPHLRSSKALPCILGVRWRTHRSPCS
eukprot:scaffold264494_cov27-Tisochrysis_lutea.AAC.2